MVAAEGAATEAAAAAAAVVAAPGIPRVPREGGWEAAAMAPVLVQ